jgi:hypothetical protein
MTDSRSRAGLVLAYVAAAAVGYFAGTQGAFGSSKTSSAAATPRSRVGFALREQSPQASPKSWEKLRRDVTLVHDSLPEGDRRVFELVSALRGLENGGTTDWDKAQRLCQALEWPRCSRDALEELKKRSRP